MEKKKKPTQTEIIKNYLMEHPDGITSWEAFELFGITRLSAKIYDLKHKEHLKIDKDREISINRYGNKVSYDRYFIVEDKEDVA